MSGPSAGLKRAAGPAALPRAALAVSALCAVLAAGPAPAGGIDEPVIAPERIAGRATPPKSCWLNPSACNGGDGASHNTPATAAPPVVTGGERPKESKAAAMARVYGIVNEDWKAAPDGGVAARSYWENNGREAGEADQWADFNG